ncbi:MAG TPA: hypothetical protein PLJ21_04880 [Pseudobdellovibrionaceae bacterium]|nr:hypothetical protein [Pseudobdellovibrionaceae bacterium]
MKFSKKFTLIFMAVGLVHVSAFAESQVDEKYFQLGEPEVTDVSAKYPDFDSAAQPGLGEDCNASGKSVFPRVSTEPIGKDFNPLNDIEAIVDRVINVGKKLWDVVVAGSPVVNVKLQTANALPQGLQCWVDLQGWKMPQTKVYQVAYRNGFGAEVVSFAFRVSFTAGGSASGVGKYITNATMMTADLNVGWGFTFNAAAEVPSVFNMGTAKDPIAGLQMLMKWSVKTPLKYIETSESFFMNGENQLVHLK